MNTLLKSLLGDGAGNVSSMRVLILLVAVALIGSKFYNAYLTKSPIVWDSSDWQILATLIGGKLVQNTQEKEPVKPETISTPAGPVK